MSIRNLTPHLLTASAGNINPVSGAGSVYTLRQDILSSKPTVRPPNTNEILWAPFLQRGACCPPTGRTRPQGTTSLPPPPRLCAWAGRVSTGYYPRRILTTYGPPAPTREQVESDWRPDGEPRGGTLRPFGHAFSSLKRQHRDPPEANAEPHGGEGKNKGLNVDDPELGCDARKEQDGREEDRRKEVVVAILVGFPTLC